MRQALRTSGLLDAWVENPYQWVRDRVGTVHTVHGREAEAVFFILGAPDLQQRGARGWAGGRPNLLNVAATRAKEALYVVGNRSLWKRPAFSSHLTTFSADRGTYKCDYGHHSFTRANNLRKEGGDYDPEFGWRVRDRGPAFAIELREQRRRRICLTWIKLERQLRKLAANLVYQASTVQNSDQVRFRKAIYDNSGLSHHTFMGAIHHLSGKSLKDLMGEQYRPLKKSIDASYAIRQKIFHGQQTGKSQPPKP